MTRREDFFLKTPDGAQDQIHLSDLGAWLVATVHYAVLYQQSPEGLPAALLLADEMPAPEAERALQQVVWEVVWANPAPGSPPTRGP